MVRFNCPACSATGNVKDEHVGRKILCPKCKARLLFVADGVAKLLPKAATSSIPGEETKDISKEIPAQASVTPHTTLPTPATPSTESAKAVPPPQAAASEASNGKSEMENPQHTDTSNSAAGSPSGIVSLAICPACSTVTPACKPACSSCGKDIGPGYVPYNFAQSSPHGRETCHFCGAPLGWFKSTWSDSAICSACQAKCVRCDRCYVRILGLFKWPTEVHLCLPCARMNQQRKAADAAAAAAAENARQERERIVAESKTFLAAPESRLKIGYPLLIGQLQETVGSLILANLDPGETAMVVMGSIGVDTLTITTNKLLLIVAQKDWENSDDGTVGMIAGGVAGDLLGDGVGSAIGWETGGIGGMIVGGLIGSAVGMAAGGAVGKNATLREAVDIIPVPIPFGIITGIGSGVKCFRTNNRELNLPTITIATLAHEQPIQFVYPAQNQDFGRAFVRLLKILNERALTAEDKKDRESLKEMRQVHGDVPAAALPVPGDAPTDRSSGSGADVPLLLKQLAELKASGVLSEEEFQQKKKDLLSRM